MLPDTTKQFIKILNKRIVLKLKENILPVMILKIFENYEYDELYFPLSCFQNKREAKQEKKSRGDAGMCVKKMEHISIGTA